MAKRKELVEGQKWAYVTRRNDLHDNCEGYVCTIAPQPTWLRNNDVMVSVQYRNELAERHFKIQLWQLKELWETFEPKKKNAWVAYKKQQKADEKARKARRIHEDEVAQPARKELARLLETAVGGHIFEWNLERCFDEDQITKLTALLVEHGVSSDKAAA